MKLPVQCLLIRGGGSVVDFTDASYHFRPENDPLGKGRHIAVITNKAHMARLMAIPEAYELVDDEPAEPAPALTATAPLVTLQPPAPATTSAPPSTGGVAMDPGPVTLEPSPDDAPSPPAATSLPTEVEFEAMTLDQVRVQYQAETGKTASVAAKAPLLIARILGTRDEKSPA